MLKILLYLCLIFSLTHANNGLCTQDQIELSTEVLKYVKHKNKLIVINHVTIVDGTGNQAKRNQIVIIENGLFKSTGNTKEISIPTNAVVINAKGKTLIPGIIGVHNHLHIPQNPFIGEIASKLYLASGVTTIQTCGAAAPIQEIELSKNINSGKTIGPTIINSGPYITGDNGNPNMIIPKSETHIREVIQYWTKKGVNWFKVYRNTSPEYLAIIIDEAHKQKAKVTGHLCSITFEQATKLGIDGIEHGLNSASDFRKNKTDGVCDGSREYMDQLDISSEKVINLQRLMVRNNVFLTSTLATYEASIHSRSIADKRSLNIMSKSMINSYKRRKNQLTNHKSNDIREKRLKKIMAFEYQFFKMGGLLTAGVDAGRHVLPGFGDQRNFQLLIEAGFTTEQAIKIMTYNGAKALTENQIGSIAVGKRADFVLLDGDLTQDPSVIKKIETVFKNGYGYDPNLILRELTGKFGVQ